MQLTHQSDLVIRLLALWDTLYLLVSVLAIATNRWKWPKLIVVFVIWLQDKVPCPPNETC